LKKDRKLFIEIYCAKVAVFLCAVIICVVLFITRDTTEMVIGFFDEQPSFDYAQFLSENAIKEMFDDKGGFAFCKDALIYYENGEYKKTDVALCFLENDVLYINSGEHGKCTPEELAAKLKAKYVVYDDSLAVFSYKEDFADTFSDIYTLEAFALRLKGADEADIVNAFLKLPNFVSNGTTNSVFYTEPNLDLGIQTQVYSLALDNFDTGYEKVSKAPMIVAGQGKNANNNTLVRVFNKSQACISQFLAYDADVKGGVQVKAGVTESGKERIVTAAYDGTLNSAKAIRVFDKYGTLCFSFKPEGIGAPYAIEVGKFLDGSKESYIFVSSLNYNGVVHLYSLKDGSFIKTVKGVSDNKLVNQEIVLSSENLGSKEQLLVTFMQSRKVFRLDCDNSQWSDAGISLSENVTGIYASAFGGELAASLNEETFSNIKIYGTGSSYEETKDLNVGDKENHFYASAAEKNSDGYVEYASFQHLRTDLTNSAIYGLESYAGWPKKVQGYLDALTYSDWKYKFGSDLKNLYHSQYNMWEPCFTHRWNETPATNILVNMKYNGFPLYASIGKDNFDGLYNELDSAFLVGSYADGLILLEKMRIYPLRTALQQLAVEFRGENGEPEKLVGVTPVHEHEINVAGSVGDYNPKMIEGFRNYLLSLYGSVENINKRFGTNFKTKADIDAPRYDPEDYLSEHESRGDWDVYGGSDYFTQWSLYTRTVVNKRIMEAYREALLAGFPPEAINAHQIPEGDAVNGFLGEANTRLSPTDVVAICGTAYGGTRYGMFLNDVNNFIALAYGAGHNNISLGEYCSLENDSVNTYEQLKYLFDNGVKYVNLLVPYPSDTARYKLIKKAEVKAVEKLQGENQPRTSSTGGTGAVVAVNRGEDSFNIVQIGDADLNGLLKSVKQDGTWEGSVYLVPFRTAIEVKNIDYTKKSGVYTFDKINGMQYGDQIELTFHAKYTGKGNAQAKIEVYHAGCLISDATAVYDVTNRETPYRYVFSNQLALEDIEIRLSIECEDNSNFEIEHLECTAQKEQAAHKYFGDTDCATSKGGVSFDIIE